MDRALGMKTLRQIAAGLMGCVNSPHRKVGVRVPCRLNPHLAVGAIGVCMLAVLSTGCISTGQTIRVSGEIVTANGQPVPDAVVLATSSKRGGSIVGIDKQSDKEDVARRAVVKTPGDGTFRVASRWAGTLTLSVKGYKIRRVDELGTAFLVPNRSFFQSENQVRLEVVKDE